ncbi:MAG: superoxide dismutase, Cu-Zn family [Mycobacterium sp.]|jgi:Cu-Zn family superoxide dismutase|nr:superoxide dismutase, Cu-Zn family [Mycobacterium sp.]
MVAAGWQSFSLSRATCGYAPIMMKHAAAAIALLAGPVTLIGGCSNQSSNNPSTSSTSGSTSSAQTLTTQLNTTDGRHVADATVDFSNGYATVTIETVAAGILSPGFHGLHIHAVGKCEADFASAGEHFQAPGHTGQPASGDLPPLLVRSDGSGKLVATSDGFTADQLKGAQGSSIVLHQGADIGAPVAAESDQRVACGVLSPATATSTSVSTSISTSTVTTTAATPVPPATVTETTSPTASTSTSSASPSTSTSTVTVIQPTLPPITVPPVPGANGG